MMCVSLRRVIRVVVGRERILFIYFLVYFFSLPWHEGECICDVGGWERQRGGRGEVVMG